MNNTSDNVYNLKDYDAEVAAKLPFGGLADLNEIMAFAHAQRAAVFAAYTSGFFSRVGAFLKHYVGDPLYYAAQSAKNFDDLSRLSAHELADIGIDRSGIAHLSAADPVLERARQDIIAFTGRPSVAGTASNDLDREIAA